MRNLQATFLQLITILFIGCSIFACSNNTSEEFDNILYRVHVGDKYGFIDAHGNIIIEPQFDYVLLPCFRENDFCYAAIYKPKLKHGLIDKTGSFICYFPDTTFALVTNTFRIHTHAVISNNKDKRGVIKTDGTVILPPIYQNIELLFEDEKNAYILAEGGNYHKDCFISDMEGHEIFQPCDSILDGYCEGLCAVKIDGKWGYMGKDGNLVIDTVFDGVRSFSEGLARVRKGEKEFFIDKIGNCSISVEKALSGFCCNRAFVVRDGDKMMIDKTGKKICSVDWDTVSTFSKEDSFAYVAKNNKAARIDTMGNIIIQGNYQHIGPFINGLARILTRDDKRGFIDKNSNVLANCLWKYGWDGTLNGSLGCVNQNLFALSDDPHINTISYYDSCGNLIWADSPHQEYHYPVGNWKRQDFIDYFDYHISELDPIEGIYYLTQKNFYQSRYQLAILR